MHLWDKDSRKVTDFTSNFSFIINQPNKTQHAGDGITFFIASPNFSLPVPPDGTGIGLVSRQQMEDQNYSNQHPYVSVEFDTFWNRKDPQYDHVGVNIKTMFSPFTTEWFSVSDGRIYDAQNESKTRLVMVLSIGAGVGLGLAFVLMLRRRKDDDLDLSMDSDFERGAGPKKFSYNELVRATNIIN
ncbi:hypothetical protein TSUD_60200 [Trifolium subterraneum]|uniref:Legume lectin domain-containing protein n=1 Tax=Trifolium subterraneum TaxID=3900 RepID=A0A2Z6NM95_TRISU|nr:hypothetical protein TSUD_60200 [Trifolium subterraneum]